MNIDFQPARPSHSGTRPLPALRTLQLARTLCAFSVGVHPQLLGAFSCSSALPSLSLLLNLPTCQLSNLSTTPCLSPFPTTLTGPSQTAENATTLSPAFVTLTDRVNHNPFVCHSYKKTPGVGIPLPALEKNVKSANTSTIIDLDRCQHCTPSGRRCKLPIEGPGKSLCYTHMQELMKTDALNLKNALLTNHQGFQTAQGINFALKNLYKLLAASYLSPRRAAVLAYINSLQLRTLPPSTPTTSLASPTPPPQRNSRQLPPTFTQPRPHPTHRPPTQPPPKRARPGTPEPDPTKKPS